MVEFWKPVVGYEGSYEVSDQGRVRSVDRLDAANRRIKGKLLQRNVTSNGYLQVNLYLDGTGSYLLVHRLVMEAFVGRCPQGKEVCHKDHVRSNNRFDNLMYGTRSENQMQSVKSKRHPRARGVRRSDGLKFDSASDASRKTGLSHSHILKACKGECNTAGGFSWEFDMSESRSSRSVVPTQG